MLLGVSPPWRIMSLDFTFMCGAGVGFRFLMNGSFSPIHQRSRPPSFGFLTGGAFHGSCLQAHVLPSKLGPHVSGLTHRTGSW